MQAMAEVAKNAVEIITVLGEKQAKCAEEMMDKMEQSCNSQIEFLEQAEQRIQVMKGQAEASDVEQSDEDIAMEFTRVDVLSRELG